MIAARWHGIEAGDSPVRITAERQCVCAQRASREVALRWYTSDIRFQDRVWKLHGSWRVGAVAKVQGVLGAQSHKRIDY